TAGTLFQKMSTSSLYAHLYDRGGNWLGIQTSDWAYEGTIPPAALGPVLGLQNALGDVMPTTSEMAWVNFIPQEVITPNTGKISVSMDQTIDGTAQTLTYSVPSLSVAGDNAVSFAIV